MNNEKTKVSFFKKFPPQFWLVVMFEFFERGAYYGMMSFLSVYFTDTLLIPKENVGIIKGVIQPLLYFLPIIAGAIADRFGYRKVLMVAFMFLGGGYFLTSQATTYGSVFFFLVVMGFGAGTFKPIISGTIAKITDESNSTQAFGIFYWSINLGAFLFPLVLVPILKAINPSYVIIASAISTATMLLPTALFFKEPTKQKEVDEKTEKRNKTTLLQTLANSFEIIYSPVVIIFNLMRGNRVVKMIIIVLLAVFLGLSAMQYLSTPPVSEKFPTVSFPGTDITLIFKVKRNMGAKDAYQLAAAKDDPSKIELTIFKPATLSSYAPQLISELSKYKGFETVTSDNISEFISRSEKKIEMVMQLNEDQSEPFIVNSSDAYRCVISLKSSDSYNGNENAILSKIHENPAMRGLTVKDCTKLYETITSKSFFFFFVFSLILLGLLVTAVSTNYSATGVESAEGKSGFKVPAVVLLILVMVGVCFLPGLSLLARIICFVIYLSVSSLFIIDKTDPAKFIDHARFLLMIVLYSGFWILYFQMFDSVLWYVKAYVDADALNKVVNGIPALFGIQTNWFFDVEHVTVINAGTIITLQLIISSIVKNKKAMPTLLTGFAIATTGMALLATSSHIFVFMIGIMLFSIGEMTAHPKFISYIGLIAPSDKKAMYMGYLFLYGVFGSSIGGIIGARLYVHFVDNLNQPRVLWLVFSGIGIMSIICLSLYNKFLAPQKVESPK